MKATALVNIASSFSASGKSLADIVCRHLNILYLIHFFISFINCYAYYSVFDFSIISQRYQLDIIDSGITFLLLILIVNETRNAPLKTIMADTGRETSSEKWVSIYSKFMFSWINGMMKKGSSQTLNDEDLIELIPENRTPNVLHKFRRHRKTTIALSILSAFKLPLFIQFCYCFVWSVLMFGPPYFLNRIIKYIEHCHDQDFHVPASTAFFYVLGLFLSSSIQSLSYQQALYIGRTLGIRVQSIIIGEVYNKSLKRRDESGSSTAKSTVDLAASKSAAKVKANINNLLSVDSQKMGEVMAYIFFFYCFPIQVIVCVWSLYALLGHASLWGVFVICVSQPLTYYLSKRFQGLHHEVMACTDRRIRLMTELLSAIRIIKFFAWEKQFRGRITKARDDELDKVRSRLYSFLWIGNVWFFIPVLIMIAVFYAYTHQYTLTASTAFTALALFNNFKSTLDELPFITTFILQANVSLGRIEKFLQEEEVQLPKQNFSSQTRIGFVDNANFSWYPSKEGSVAPVHLKNLNLSFPVNQLSIICGPTGSGKTTMIASLLGETYCLSGAAIIPKKDASSSCSSIGGAVSGVAYVAQTAWLQNCSIRDNILFGLPFDKDRYERVLYMTALTRDLDILEFGDSTEIGEKGITLSGGQKQRVAIARAVYSQADIVILDDCLSAVDAHTAKHLYQHCLIGDYMKHRTTILVTHHVALCIGGASYIVVLNDSGSVAANGAPLDVINTGVLGEDISQESLLLHSGAEEEAAVNGSILETPKAASTKMQINGAGKLVQEEKRAEGAVAKEVYYTYIQTTGGVLFWAAVILLFCSAQGSVLGQNYWIKIWSAAYNTTESNLVENNISIYHQMFLLNDATSQLFKINAVAPPSITEIIRQVRQRHTVDISYYLGIYFLIGLLSLALTTLNSLLLYHGSLKASKTIHNQLLDRILRAKIRFFDTTPMGRIINRFSSDLECIDQAVAPSLSALLFSVIATAYVIILVSAITPAFIVPGILIALIFRSIGTYYLETSRDMKRLNSVSRSPIYVQFNETVLGVATIRAFGCQERFIKENHNKIDCNNRPFLWMWATNRWLHCRVDILGGLVSFCTGVVLVISCNWVNPGLAGLSLSYALTFTRHVLWVVRMYAVNEMNMNAIERVCEYLDIEEEAPTHIPEACPPSSWPENGVVEINDLYMQYAQNTPAVLRGLSFKTRPREKIGIVGRTGSGKSTLGMSLFRFMEPTSGQICIDGVNICHVGLNDLRSRLTIIPQDPVLFTGTLRSNLDPFGQYDDAILWAALKRSHLINEPIRDMSAASHSDNSSASTSIITLDSAVTENGSNWSQGQRQLIALARALVKRTSLIVLDEATSSIDFDTDQQIQETIRKEFNNSTLLCIAHRIRTVADYDRILVLDHGQVKEFDSPYMLMKKEDSIFHQMCQRSGEFSELLAIAKAKHKKMY
ncbi:ATP-dependent bile acid permease [Choanephora cucurbitarum]|uniref:ATP-dependent bile acid permease n=1 Tax=Choanephora cucurbitarum TaxID=101091 RepID=A0A1C7N6B1_9FUNG|nr:ATP-dependent bile acid permease [Choanephora cucurbitarum]